MLIAGAVTHQISTIGPSSYKPNTVPILVTPAAYLLPAFCSPVKLAALTGGLSLLKANQ